MKTIYTKLLLLLLLLPFTALAQSTLKGNVSDATSGQPIPGANVLVEGTSNGTSTDMDGNFTLANVKQGDRIVVSFIGYSNQVVEYKGQATLNVVLQEDATQLQEVVVIGYGTTTKKDATGALVNIKAEQFNKGPLVSADQLLQGRVSGLQITNAGGEPGGGAQVRIRAGASITATNDPLYVVDGVVLDTGGGGSTGGRNPLADINPNDIASMTVLKDAAATAIYGSRASNGVIIITTKRGQSGEMKISYNGNYQVNEVVKTVDVMNADQYRAFVNQYGTDAQKALLGTANTNWQDLIYRTAQSTDHNIALSGGTDNITYRTSLGYTNMNGLLQNDNFERTTLGVNLVGKFFDDHLKIEVNNKSSIMNNNYGNRDAVGAAIAFDPTQNVYDPNSGYTYFQWLGDDTNGDGRPDQSVNASRNPLSLLNQKTKEGSAFRSIGNAQFDYKIHGFEDLKLVANFGYDYASGRYEESTDLDYVVVGERGAYGGNTRTNKNMLMDLYFNYNKDVEALNTVFDVTAGYNYQDFRYEYNSFNYEAANGIVRYQNPSISRVNLQSYFGRATATVADKYILTGSLRADASSRFPRRNRWGYFPSVAAAWKINEESFLKNVNAVSELKLRASWGMTGQQDLGELARYPSVPLYLQSTSTAGYQMGYDAAGNPIFISTYRPLSYNSNLKWEETETINLGLDFGFFDNRVTGSVEVYKRKTTDLLLYAQNPQGVNFSNYANYNIGAMDNKGLEISADVYPVKNDNVTWRVGGNITFQNSEVTQVANGASGNFQGYYTGGITGGTGTNIQNFQTGYSPRAFYVYEQAYDAAGKPLDGVFVDRNGDGIINPDDMYRYKKPQADVFYGFNTDVSYGNWWLSTSFHGSWGNYNYNNVFSNYGNQSVGLPSNGPYLNNVHTNVTETGFTSPRYLSDYYVQNAAFLRMDNVTLGYTFKNVFSENSTLRITGAVQNVFVITDYDGIDPEVQDGIDNNIYPRPRTYTLGLNVNF